MAIFRWGPLSSGITQPYLTLFSGLGLQFRVPAFFRVSDKLQKALGRENGRMRDPEIISDLGKRRK